MPLHLNREVFITCAVTGSGGTQDRSPHVPRSPREIADSALAAAEAGAAIVHCHVRDPDTGAPSRDPVLYRELTEREKEAFMHGQMKTGTRISRNTPEVDLRSCVVDLNLDIAEDGYRLLINTNKNAGQEVFHLHMHLFAGRPLGPMLLRKK